MKTVYWLQGGGCGGDTYSLLSSDFPDITEIFSTLHLELLWHPTISSHDHTVHEHLLAQLISGDRPLDILIVEGSILCGPAGTGMFDTIRGRAKKELFLSLAHQAQWVVAMGTCAAFGGFGTDHAVEATGLQFLKGKRGGALGEHFTAGSGMPVINLAGCPCHHDVIAGTLLALAADTPLALDEFQRPMEWYNTMVHQGCTRNEYHEYRIEESDFGEMGCLFFHMGCAGPLVPGPCNRLLWNRQSSKPRAGVPCFGCTDPEFPRATPFFHTPNIEGIPLALPRGVNRAHYMVYKGMAAEAAPDRLRKRSVKV